MSPVRASLFIYHLHIWSFSSAYSFLLLPLRRVYTITSSLYLDCCVICKCFCFLFHVREFCTQPFAGCLVLPLFHVCTITSSYLYGITSSLYLDCYVICKCFYFLFHVRELCMRPFAAGGFSLPCFFIYHHRVSCS